ncbi:hypothetical protein HZS_7538 [Henneguya salminicola]|nr:hypothetical protein HZS_7538 [Henneguya salminicola]
MIHFALIRHIISMAVVYLNIKIFQYNKKDIDNDTHFTFGIYSIYLKSRKSLTKLFDRRTYNEKNPKFFYDLTMIVKALRNEYFVIFVDRTKGVEKKLISFPSINFLLHNIDNRYNYCTSNTNVCLNIRIM